VTGPKRTHELITPEHRAKIALIFVRQSSPAQVRDHTGSAAVQYGQVQHAVDFGFTDIRVIDDDTGKSATSTVGRVGWHETFRLIGGEAVGGVFTFNTSRLSREMRDFSQLVFLCRIYRVPIVLDGQPNDPNNPANAALLYVSGVFAELDGRTRAEGLKRARLAKAQQGIVVSAPPVGWVRGPDGLYAFDPEAHDRIAEVYDIFEQRGSIRGTVAVLNQDGKLLPTRHRGRIVWKQATLERAHNLLLNPTYTGLYTFGQTEMQYDRRAGHEGDRVQRPVPEDRWIRVPGLFPAYITPERQAAIRLQVGKNAFVDRHRPGRGRALLQGLVLCGACGARLTVCDPGPATRSHYYMCSQKAATLGVQPCLSFPGRDLDAAVERFFLRAVAAPPLPMLEQALAEARGAEATRVNAVEAERKQLQYHERLAQDRYEAVDPRNTLVFAAAVEEFETAKQALKAFEFRRAAAPPPPTPLETADELRVLVDLVSDVPRLWRHPLVSMQERKTMLGCLIDRIVIHRTDEAIEATIMWASDAETTLRVWRRRGLDDLIRRLHAEGMTVQEIRAALAVGDPETGQRWSRTASGIYQVLKRLGLRPHPVPRGQPVDRTLIRRLYDDGLTLNEIADQLNARGLTTARGKQWTSYALQHWLGRGGRREQLEELHRAVIEDAKRRGLTNRQAANEFNAQAIPRVGKRRWTADVVRQRRVHLKQRWERKANGTANSCPPRDADPQT
jgi:DNA invertase Pin-like site-specific DNA recombinase